MVSTIRSFSRARTKHAPRAPSFSRQSRGHISHCTRPSSSIDQCTEGTMGPRPRSSGGRDWCSIGMSGIASATGLDPSARGVPRQAGL